MSLMSAPMSLCAVVVLVATARASVMHLSSLQFKHNLNIHTQQPRLSVVTVPRSLT